MLKRFKMGLKAKEMTLKKHKSMFWHFSETRTKR